MAVAKPITPAVARSIGETLATIAEESGFGGQDDKVAQTFLQMADGGALTGGITRGDLEAAGIVEGDTIKYETLKAITEGRSVA